MRVRHGREERRKKIQIDKYVRAGWIGRVVVEFYKTAIVCCGKSDYVCRNLVHRDRNCDLMLVVL